MNRDRLLLTRYAIEHSDAAFTELVHLHAGLVYGAALRRAGGDTAMAEEAMQRVFVRLARDAGRLATHPALVAWLYTASRNATIDLLRASRKRRVRERQATLMLPTPDSLPPASDAPDLRAVLDPAMDALTETDRTTILLRFFEQRPFADIGRTLRISEDAARMRTARALDQLRTHLRRRGIVSTAAALAGHLVAQSSATVSMTLIRKTASGALARASFAPALFSGGTFLAVLSTAAAIALTIAWRPKSTAGTPRPPPPTAPASNPPVDTPQPGPLASARASAPPPQDALTAAAARRFFYRNWGWRLEAMGVPAAEYERLEGITLAEVAYSFRFGDAGWGFSPANADSIQQATAALRAGLAPDARLVYDQEFLLTSARTLAHAVAAAAFQAGEPLLSTQSSCIVQSIARHGLLRGPASSAIGIPPIATGFDRVDWTAVEAELHPELSAGQLQLLAQSRAWLESRRDGELLQIRREAKANPHAAHHAEDPDVAAHTLRTLRARLPLQNAGFYRANDLAPGQIAALEEALVARAGRLLDLRATERHIRIDPAHVVLEERRTADGRRVRVQVDGAIAALREAEAGRFQAELAAVLGAAGADRFRRFEHEAAPREFAAHLIATLTLRGISPRPAQAQAIALAAAAGNFASASPTKMALDDFQPPRASEGTWQTLLDAAATQLSPEQVAVVRIAAARADDERAFTTAMPRFAAQSRP